MFVVSGRVTSDNSSCYSCALRSAVDMISAEDNVKTVIIMVRSDTDTDISDEDDTDTDHVPVYSIIVGGDDEIRDTDMIQKKRVFSVSDGPDQQTQFSDVFLAIDNDVEQDQDHSYAKFYHHQLQDADLWVQGKFSVEESLRSQLRVVVTTHSKADIEKFELVSPSGKNHKFPFVERGAVYFQFDSDAEPGIWTWSISRPSSTPLTLSAYAKTTGDNAVTVSTWSHVAENSMSEPVKLYTEVRSGHVPVSGARVLVSISGPDGRTTSLLLSDNGSGYPDITANDGVYSGYFTQFSDKPGLYSVSVQVSDGAGSAQLATVSYASASDCCGSTWPAVTTIPAPPFSRLVTGASLYIGQGAQFFIQNGVPRMRDMFPPARVTDLALSSDLALETNDSNVVSVSWTAPGDDYDQDTADQYQLKCADNRSIIMTSFSNVSSVVSVITPVYPGAPGSVEEARLSVPAPDTDLTLYCGLVTLDEADNESPVSNIITVFIKHVPEDDEDDGWAETGLFKQNSEGGAGQLDNMLIYIITGGGVIIVIILIFVIICIVQKPKKEKKNKAPMITEISSPTLIHSSSALPGILKPDSGHHHGALSVLPTSSSNEYALDYSPTSKSESRSPGDMSWAILPSYSNVAFKKSSETIVDSGFYRAGEAVDNVYEYYQPSAEYAIYQQVNKEKRCEDISDNGTATTDCEISDTHSDKMMRHFAAAASSSAEHGKILSSPSSDFHSLIVTSEDFKKAMADMDQSNGPVSLPHFSNFEDFAERRRRRESFV